MTVDALVRHFGLGVGTPLSAVCVIPLYPAFIAFLASADGEGRRHSPVVLGLLVVAGVVAFMAAVGVVYSFVLGEAINDAVETFSPVAFWILAGVGLVMLTRPTLFSGLPAVEPPQSEYPALSAFSYGFFFGAIIIPCNPGLIATFFSTTPILYDTQVGSMLGFLSFGLGLGTPLLGFALVSESTGRRLTRLLARHSEHVYRVTGVIVLGVAVYYIWFVLPTVPPVLTDLLPG
jgi:cytochrome c-type biogenesis protein